MRLLQLRHSVVNNFQPHCSHWASGESQTHILPQSSITMLTCNAHLFFPSLLSNFNSCCTCHMSRRVDNARTSWRRILLHLLLARRYDIFFLPWTWNNWPIARSGVARPVGYTFSNGSTATLEQLTNTTDRYLTFSNAKTSGLQDTYSIFETMRTARQFFNIWNDARTTAVEQNINWAAINACKKGASTFWFRFTNHWYSEQKIKKDRSYLFDCVTCGVATSSTLVPSEDKTCPSSLCSSLAKVYFYSFTLRPPARHTHISR